MAVCSCLIKIGIIGGSGFDDPDILENKEESKVTTPFGDPSDLLFEGDISGVRCAFIARHGRKHNIIPSNINYRANIWALKQVGCTHILATTACRSLREELTPGDIIVPHDFVDCTTKRMQTFMDGKPGSPPGVCFLPMCPAFSERVRRLLIASAKELSLPTLERATVVAVEGPRYSTRSESVLFRQWGFDIINMTTCPEVVLAKEAALLYGALALVTDYDCWRDKGDDVDVDDAMCTLHKNIRRMKKIITRTIVKISQEDWTDEIDTAKDLLKNCNQTVK